MDANCQDECGAKNLEDSDSREFDILGSGEDPLDLPTSTTRLKDVQDLEDLVLMFWITRSLLTPDFSTNSMTADVAGAAGKAKYAKRH